MHPWRSEEDAGCPALPLCLTPLRQGLTELHVFSPEHALISEPQHWHWRLARIFFFFYIGAGGSKIRSSCLALQVLLRTTPSLQLHK